MATNPRTGRPYTREELAALQGQQLDTEQQYGQDASDEYLARAKAFDPTAALNTYAQGAWGSISEGLGQTLDRLRGNSVGSGRFDTGLFDKDAGDVVRGGLRDFGNSVAQQSLAAAGLQQRNTEALGQFGTQARTNAGEQTADQRTFAENDYREQQQRKRARRGGIGSAIGGVLGAGAAVATGNPWAAGAGWQAGSALGRAASGY